ncbi:co-chaperone GroES [Fusobacterium polymorphum]|uniref:co-chaperone GroES n=1 Tax=Fusobacterium nucleatum subsp. polymorphum TaxID=76857 RepID=UPI00300AEE40
MNIKPIGERVLLKPIKKEEKTKSGILLSSKSSNTDTKNEAEVIALGKGEKLEGIKVGDKVIFNKFSGNEIEDGDIKYLIVNADDILAVIE